MKKYLIIVLLTIFSCKKEKVKLEKDVEPRWFFWATSWQPNNDKIILGGSNDTYLKVLKADDYSEFVNIIYKGTITQTKWHPSKNLLAFTVQDGKSESGIYNFDTNELKNLDSIPNSGARALSWNADGSLFAVGDNEGDITIFNDSGTLIKKVTTGQKSIIGLDWHPTENLIAAVGEKITLYDFTTNTQKHIKDREEEIEVLMLCVTWHPNGEMFVTGDYGDFQYNYPPLLQYWSKDGTRIKKIERSKAEIRNVAWNKSGKLLASTSEKIRLWNTNGKLVKEETVPYLLWGLDWNPESDKLITTDEQGNVVIWNKNLKKLEELSY